MARKWKGPTKQDARVFLEHIMSPVAMALAYEKRLLTEGDFGYRFDLLASRTRLLAVPDIDQIIDPEARPALVLFQRAYPELADEFRHHDFCANRVRQLVKNVALALVRNKDFDLAAFAALEKYLARKTKPGYPGARVPKEQFTQLCAEIVVNGATVPAGHPMIRFWASYGKKLTAYAEPGSLPQATKELLRANRRISAALKELRDSYA